MISPGHIVTLNGRTREECAAPDVDLISNTRGEYAALTPPNPPSNTARKPCRVCGSTRTVQYLNLGRQPTPDGAMTHLSLQACLQCRMTHSTAPQAPSLPTLSLGTPTLFPSVSWLLSTLSFEHVSHATASWWSVTALREYARAAGVTLREVHATGGELRATFTADAHANDSVTPFLVREHHDLTRTAYMRFSDRVTQRMADLNRRLKAFGGAYAGIGATPAATTLLNCMSVEAYPSVMYAELTLPPAIIPGTRIPVETIPDFRAFALPIVIFPGAIMRPSTLRAAGYAGEIVSL